MAQSKGLYIDLSGDQARITDDARNDPRAVDAEQTLQSFLDEYAGGSHKVSLFKLKPGTAQLEWLSHYIPSDISPETIRDEWGPGSYSLTLLDSKGHFITRRSFHIGGKPEDWDRARGFHRQQSDNGNGNGPASLELQVEMMRQNHELMLAAINAQAANRGGGLEDAVKAFVALKENSSNPSDQLAMLTQLITLAKTISGPQDNSVVGLIKEVAPAILEQIPGVAAAVQGARPAPPALPPVDNNNGKGKPAELPAPRDVPAPKPPETVAAADPAAGTQDPGSADSGAPSEDQTRLVYTRLMYWKEKARRGHKADFWIDYVFENPDEPDIAAVLWAVRHYSFATIIQLDPEIGGDEQLRRFFLDLYDGIRAELFNGTDPDGGGGDAPHAGNDAGADSGEPAQTGGEGNGDSDSPRETADQPAGDPVSG